jgi:hypothetical protein
MENQEEESTKGNEHSSAQTDTQEELPNIKKLDVFPSGDGDRGGRNYLNGQGKIPGQQQ